MRKPPKKYKSSISESCHETAQGLSRAGLITKNRMALYDALSLEPVPQYSQRAIQGLRRRLNLSQAVLAEVLNIKVSTVQKWENGDNRPAGSSARLLHMLDTKGLEVFASNR